DRVATGGTGRSEWWAAGLLSGLDCWTDAQSVLKSHWLWACCRAWTRCFNSRRPHHQHSYRYGHFCSSGCLCRWLRGLETRQAQVRGARAAGAREIDVLDCHGAGGAYSFKSCLPERLGPGAQYIFGYPWARYITPFEEGCDAILFVGAHAMAGTPDGVLCHT